MSAQTPCELGDPQDWFIEKNGRQYSDEPVLTVEEVNEVVVAAALEERDPADAVEEAAEARLAENLIKRRRAKDACYECPVRTQCLDLRLTSSNIEYGTWGGYYAEELRVLDTEIAKRAARRTDVTAGE